MFFKALRSRRSSHQSSKSNTALEIVTSSSSTHKVPVVTATDVDEDESRDYQEFLEKARREENRRLDATLKAIADADRRRKAMNMDPWAAKAGKF